MNRVGGFAVWLTGLPSSGKTTVAHAFALLLGERLIPVQILDSDDLRARLTPHPSYSPEERDWFYGMIVFLAELLTGNGVHVVISATAPRRAYRDQARSRIRRFAEVWVDCPEKLRRQRDPKGLWGRAERGEITMLPGAGTPYEAPRAPEVTVNTDRLSIEGAARHILDTLEAQGFFQARDIAGDDGGGR